MSAISKSMLSKYGVSIKRRIIPSRKSYTFKDMAVGEAELFAPCDFRRALNAAYRIGSRRGWSFSYEKDEKTGDTYIGRIK